MAESSSFSDSKESRSHSANDENLARGSRACQLEPKTGALNSVRDVLEQLQASNADSLSKVDVT